MSRKAIFILITVAAVAAFPTLNYSASSPVQPQLSPQRSERTEMQRDIEDRQRKEENKKRQEEIKTDTQKLFQLATELKDAVDKSNEHTLSLDVIKKAEEVEKLAKKVREKMKEGSGKPVLGEPQPRRPGDQRIFPSLCSLPPLRSKDLTFELPVAYSL